MVNKHIYFDFAASARLKPEALQEMLQILELEGNPSSVHFFGRKARVFIDESREKIARILGANSSEVYFSSGGTESDNLAIEGLVKALNCKNKIHVLISEIEHKAVLNTIKKLKDEGLITFDLIPVTKQGVVKVEDIEKLIKPETQLISVMYVNNEIGTVMPIKEIGEMIERVNNGREKIIYFHIS
jgi:cysteine desulfurase